MSGGSEETDKKKKKRTVKIEAAGAEMPWFIVPSTPKLQNTAFPIM